MKRVESLHAIRIFAMIYIVAFHCGLNHLGGAGVSIFVLLSGFLLVYNNWNRSVECDLYSSISYGIRKISKLYGLHLITMLMALPLLIYEVVLSHELLYRKISEFFLNLLLMKSWIPNNDIVSSLNTVSWYLSTILFLYCAFPKILKFLQNTNSNSKIVIYTIVLCLLSWSVSYLSSILPVWDDYELDTVWFFSYIFPLTRLIDFSIGCNVGYLFLHSRHDYGKVWGTILEAIAVIVLLVMEKYTLLIYGSAYSWLGYTTIYIPTSIFLIWIFASQQGLITNICSNKVFKYFGDRSSYVFLFNHIISRYLRNNVIYQFEQTINCWIMFALTLGISLVLAELYAVFKGDTIWHRIRL